MSHRHTPAVRFPATLSLSAPATASRRRGLAMLLLAGAACLAVGSARAEEGELQEHKVLQQQAVNGQWADVGTTGIGLAMGASEANPLGILTLGVKAYAYAQIKEAPLVEQPRMWSAYGAFGWGAAANNVCIIAAIASGGAAAAVCPLIGLAAGVTTWNADEEKRNRATFAAICEQERQTNPTMSCTYGDQKI